MESNRIKANLSDPLADHIQVSGLVQKVLDRFKIVSVGDLCSLDIEVVRSEKGVGTKKVETLLSLIEQQTSTMQAYDSQFRPRRY